MSWVVPPGSWWWWPQALGRLETHTSAAAMLHHSDPPDATGGMNQSQTHAKPRENRQWSYNFIQWNLTNLVTPGLWDNLVCVHGGAPRVVVSTAAFHTRVRGSTVPGIGGLKETKNVSSPSTCESQYCGEPPWPRGSVLGLRPLALEFRILCLEDSVISIIWQSSGGSPGPV